MKNSKFKIDLHVHSPASEDFKGNKGRSGYISLITAYRKANVSTMAFTDHNTIQGYREYQKIKEETKLNYNLNSNREDSGDLLKILKEEMLAFSSVHVIPGVELSVYPGIHMILIFDEEVNVDTIEEFLRTDLKLGDAVDSGSSDTVCKGDPISILTIANDKFGDKYISILPHVDSSKGVWKELSGISRSEIIKNPNVMALQIVNPESIKYIEEAIKNDEYKRSSHLGFIQASDYHGDPSTQPASQYFTIDNNDIVTFNWLKQNIVKKHKYRNSFEFTDENYGLFIEGKILMQCDIKDKFIINDDCKDELTAKLCGCLNTNNAIIQFNILNIKDDYKSNGDKIASLINELLINIDPPQKINFTIYNYSHSEARQRHLVQINSNNKIRLYKEKVLMIDDKTIRPAKSWEIEKLAAQLSFSRYGRSKRSSLKKSSESLLMISNSLSAIPLVIRVDQLLTFKLHSEIELNIIKPIFPSEIKNKDESNGVINGDYYLLSDEYELRGGRLMSNDYYRFSLPSYKKPTQVTKLPKTETIRDNSLVITPDGGVNYANLSSIIYAPFPIYTIQYKIKTDNDDLLLGLIAYLKSTFLLWYICMIYETNDLFTTLIRGKKLPLPLDNNLLKSLASISRNILLEEKNVLKQLQKNIAESEKIEYRTKEIAKHNASCLNNMKLIDKEIFRYFKLSGDDIREIYKVISELDLYDYDISLDLDKFIKEVNK